jgi:hypothetical protein
MRASPSLFALILTILSPISTEAQRRYTVYKTNEFGHKSVLSQPEAFIEEDPLSGDLKVYEPGLLGLPDTVKGPTYIIENDSIVPFNQNLPSLEQLPHLGDTLHSNRDHDHHHDHHHHHDSDTDDDMNDMAEDW